jgi:gamma-glutamyltranspeptidase/glutathione hydrolase
MSKITRGAIAAGHPNTAEAGLEMLRQGGNAFDAAVAAVLAACAVEPCLTSLAGGGFLLAHRADNQNILFDFFAQTPRQRRASEDIDFYPVEVNFGTATQEFHIGLGSIAVPGTVAGLFHVHQRLGRLPFKALVEPAVHYAREGVPLNPFQAYCFRILRPIWLAAPEMQSLIAPAGQVLQGGDRLALPQLADTLAYLAEAGAAAFYQGDIAHQLVEDCQARGGHLTLADLRHYQVIEREPLALSYRGKTFLSNPPPSSGGTLIACALSLLSQVDPANLRPGSLAYLVTLANAMRLTNLARKDGYDHRLYEPDIAQTFLAPRHLQPYIEQMVAPVNKWGSTTHISVIDSEGNAASVTTSNGEGSAYVIQGTGVMVNNMLGEEDLHPGGFHQWRENMRISSMMAPTMVLHRGRPEIVLGSGGSNRIRTAILQVITNIIDLQMPVEEAVTSPRLHWENGVLNLEPGLHHLVEGRSQFPFDGDVVRWDQQNMFFGGVHTVLQDDQGTIIAAGDPRRSGAIAFI